MSHTTTPQIPSSKLFDLTGQNVAITGATRGESVYTFVNFSLNFFSLGIGLACAKALIEAGASICLLIRPSSSPPSQLDDKLFDNQKICTFPCDLGTLKASNADEVILGAETQLGGPIDILVNCAGIQRRAKAEEFPEDAWNEVQLLS
jgi:2-dehydro-3-deoxy-D-gluconate 5-dehydrogenase